MAAWIAVAAHAPSVAPQSGLRHPWGRLGAPVAPHDERERSTVEGTGQRGRGVHADVRVLPPTRILESRCGLVEYAGQDGDSEGYENPTRYPKHRCGANGGNGDFAQWSEWYSSDLLTGRLEVCSG